MKGKDRQENVRSTHLSFTITLDIPNFIYVVHSLITDENLNGFDNVYNQNYTTNKYRNKQRQNKVMKINGPDDMF